MLIETVLGCGSICRNKRYLLALLAVLALPVFAFMQRFCLKMCPRNLYQTPRHKWKKRGRQWSCENIQRIMKEIHFVELRLGNRENLHLPPRSSENQIREHPHKNLSIPSRPPQTPPASADPFERCLAGKIEEEICLLYFDCDPKKYNMC